MGQKKFYVTCAIPYVNAAPHIGHALEFIQGDVIARYHDALGQETYLLSGGDENALKNIQAAEKAGLPRENLYGPLGGDAKLEFGTVIKEGIELSPDNAGSAAGGAAAAGTSRHAEQLAVRHPAVRSALRVSPGHRARR